MQTMESVLVWAFNAVWGALCFLLWNRLEETRHSAERANMDLASYKEEVAKMSYATNEQLLVVGERCRESYEAVLEKLGEINIDIKHELHKLSHEFRDRLDSKQDKS